MCFDSSDPIVATGDYGVSSDAVSAYGAKLLGLPGTGENIISDGCILVSGSGNAAILRHIVKALLPDAIGVHSRSFADVLYAPINSLPRSIGRSIRASGSAPPVVAVAALMATRRPRASSMPSYLVGEQLARAWQRR